MSSSSMLGGGSGPRARSWKQYLPMMLAAVFLLAILLPLLGRLRSLHWQDHLAEKSTRTLIVFKEVCCPSCFAVWHQVAPKCCTNGEQLFSCGCQVACVCSATVPLLGDGVISLLSS